MSQHISRKELKKDEVRETLAHGAEAVFSHQKLLGIVVGVVVIVALGIVGWRFYSNRQTLKASTALDDAMKVFEARIRVPGEPAEPGEVTYVDEKNKYTDAAKKFVAVAQGYGRTRPGQMARYYAALSYERLDQNTEALKWLDEFERTGVEDFASLARFERAGLYSRTGKGDEAVKIYRQLADHPSVLVPKPLVLLTLGDYLRAAKPDEAAKLYNEIKKDFPDSPLSDEADKRLEDLGAKT